MREYETCCCTVCTILGTCYIPIYLYIPSACEVICVINGHFNCFCYLLNYMYITCTYLITCTLHVHYITGINSSLTVFCIIYVC